jgi:hypothetical protein
MTNKLQTKFAIGDKVVRTKPYFAGGDFGFMHEGKVCIVEFITGRELIKVIGSNMEYDVNYFNLVEEKPTFKAMKFRVESPEHSKEIQEALFSMGYGWEQYGKEVKWIEDGNTYIYLNTDEDGILTRSWKDPDCDVTPSSPFYHPEYTIKTTKSYELIPVEITKEETIELMGQKYSKKELEDALRSLKPIV